MKKHENITCALNVSVKIWVCVSLQIGLLKISHYISTLFALHDIQLFEMVFMCMPSVFFKGTIK